MADKSNKANAKDDGRVPEAKAAWDAFDRGDNRSARKLAKGLLAQSPTDPVRRNAQDILDRTGLEPGVELTLVGMVLAVAGIVVALVLRR